MIIRVIKSVKIRWAGQERCIQNFGGEIKGKETTWKALAYMGGIILYGSSRRGVRRLGLG